MIIGICASTREGIIGNNNKMPWNIKEELKSFKEETQNNIIIMGRKTFDSIGKPLPNRKNIVISRQQLQIDGVTVLNINDEKVNELMKKTCYIIGGSEIFHLFKEKIDVWKISWIDYNYPGNIKINWETILNDFEIVETNKFNEFTKCTYKRKSEF